MRCISLDRSDFHMTDNLSIPEHAFAYSGRVHTTIKMHHMDANKVYKEKAGG